MSVECVWTCVNCQLLNPINVYQCELCNQQQTNNTIVNNGNVDKQVKFMKKSSSFTHDVKSGILNARRQQSSDDTNSLSTRPVNVKSITRTVQSVQHNINKAGRLVQRAVGNTVSNTVGHVIDSVRGRCDASDLMHKSLQLTYKQINQSKLQDANNANNDIIQNIITPEWYTIDFDPLESLLNDSDCDLSIDSISMYSNRYKSAQQYIDRQLSNEVMNNYGSFVAGVTSIDATQNELSEITSVVSSARKHVQSLNKLYSINKLSVLYSYRKKCRTVSIIVRLKEIIDLIEKEKEIKLLLSKHEFISAVQSYKQCIQKLSQSHLQRFECLIEWRSRFIHTSELLNQSVRQQLLLLCTSFNTSLAENVVQAMLSLGEIAMLPELLKTYASKALQQTSIALINKYTKSNYTTQNSNDEMSMKEILLNIDTKQQRDLVLSLCELYSNVLYSNHKMIQYISELYSVMTSLQSPAQSSTSYITTLSVIEQTQQLLLELRQLLIESIIDQISTLLSTIQINKQTITLTSAVQLFNALYNFCIICDRYNRSTTTTLSAAINRKCREYLRVYHIANIQDIQYRLECDKWLCIDKPKQSGQPTGITTATDDMIDVLQPINTDTIKSQLYQQCIDGTNPYTVIIQQLMNKTYNQPKSINIDISSISCNVLTSSVVIVGKYIQSYLNLSNSLPVISSDCMQCVRDVYDFYVYSVFCYFGIAQNYFFDEQSKTSTDKYIALKRCVVAVKNNTESGKFAYECYKQHINHSNTARLQSSGSKSVNINNNSSHAQSQLHQQRQNEIDNSKSLTSSASFDLLRNLHKAADVIERGIDNIVPVDKHSYPELCGVNNHLHTQLPDKLFGITQRVISAQSAQYITILLQLIQQHYASTFITTTNTEFSSVIDYTSEVFVNLSQYMFRNITPYVLKINEWKLRLQQTRFDQKLTNNKVNIYVSDILKCCNDSEQKLISTNMPANLLTQVWCVSIQFLCERLIEEYSAQHKKYNAEGRLQIHSDVDALINGMKLINQTITIDYFSALTTWLQLFTYTKQQLVQYIESATNTYSNRQLMYVAENGDICNKSSLLPKQRQQVLLDIEDALMIGNEARKKKLLFQDELKLHNHTSTQQLHQPSIATNTIQLPINSIDIESSTSDFSLSSFVDTSKANDSIEEYKTSDDNDSNHTSNDVS